MGRLHREASVRSSPRVTSRWSRRRDSQVAVVYLDGRLARVIAPANRVLFWRGAVDVTFELIDVRAEPEVPRACCPRWLAWGARAGVTFAAVDEGKRGLLYLDGRLVRELGPGTYGFWNAVRGAAHRGARNAPPDGGGARSGDPDAATRSLCA